MSHACTHSENRADVLLLLATLAHLFSVLVGIAAEATHLHLRFQANTVKNKRVLSLAMLGRLVAGSGTDRIFKPAFSTATWSTFAVRARQALAF